MTATSARAAILRLLHKLDQATRDGHVWIGAGDAENALEAFDRLEENAKRVTQ